ncbi:MAG: hypothetical protein KDK36_21420 [Leptospiraceae bacterium]|nr:hypothetical protein [Leptospiraceae bacterium]
MAKYTPEEQSRISEILEPLNRNPVISESLNPMAKPLRKIKGEPEPEIPDEEEDEVEDDSSYSEPKGEEEGGINFDTSGMDLSEPPPFRQIDDDDTDIDALLNDDFDAVPSVKKEKPQDEVTDDFGLDDTTSDDLNLDDLTTPDTSEISGEEDPFTGLGDDTSEEEPTTTGEEDPFGGLDEDTDSSEEPTTTGEEDPFSGLGDDTDSVEEPTTTGEEDPFAGLGDDTETPDSTGEEDPFTGFGDDTETSEKTEEDPFAGLGDDTETSDSTGEEDPFAGFGDDTETSDSSGEEDPFAGFGDDTSTESSIGDEDPFAGLGDDTDAAEEEPSTTGDTDPFAGLGDDTDISEEQTPTTGDEDPFAGLGDDTGIAEEQPPATGDEDPFAGMDDDFGDMSDLGDTTGTQDDAVPDFSGLDDDFGSLEDEQPVSQVTDDDHDHFADIASSTTFGDDDLEAPDLSFQSLSDTETSEEESLGGLGNLDEDDVDLGGTYEESLEEDLSSLAEDDTLAPEEDLTDEELAIIQQEIINYPPKLKRTVIDAITNDKLPVREQRELLELIKASQPPADIATYLSEKLGYEVELYDKTGTYSEKGIPIIATKPIYTKQGEFERRQFIKRTILGAAAAILGVFTLVAGYKYVLQPFRAATHYKDGLDEIKKAGIATSIDEKRSHLRNAESSFQKGEDIFPNDLEYLNAYGMAYMKIGEYDKSFEKLFGKVEPDFGKESEDKEGSNSWNKRVDVPIITLSPKYTWDESKLQIGFNKLPEDNRDILRMRAQDGKDRKIIKPGAYIVAELGKKEHDNTTYINLGKFHSNNAKTFVDAKVYKNDQLAVNYYKQVFTDGGEPDNIEATAGLAKIYYNQKNFGKASSYYNKIIEAHPKNPIGHGGLISTYIEMWKRDKNPQFVLNHHRQVRNVLGIEDDLSLYTLSKLAGFFIDLNPTELRIKYNVNPEDKVTNYDIDQDIIHLLNIAFSKSEMQDGLEVTGDEYAEQYYQRGRYYINKNESLRALKQFELAASYDPAHYLAVMEMAEHYMRIEDYKEAKRLLENAKKRHIVFNQLYGNKEEDETLIDGDIGRVYFNLGKIVYINSALISEDDKMDEFPARKVYPSRSLGKLSEKDSERRNDLNNARSYFEAAIKNELKDPSKKRELHYYQGWIDYMNSDYESALAHWANLEEEDNYNNVNVMLGKANSFYYSDQLNASLGNYLKIKEDFEEKEALIATPVPEESTHQEIYQTLIAVYNNIGAVYEKKGNTAQALKHYWRSIEIARKINTTTEIANYNKDMAFKNRGGKEPLLDDWLSPTIDTIKELRKSKRKNVYL